MLSLIEENQFNQKKLEKEQKRSKATNNNNPTTSDPLLPHTQNWVVKISLGGIVIIVNVNRLPIKTDHRVPGGIKS